MKELLKLVFIILKYFRRNREKFGENFCFLIEKDENYLTAFQLKQT